MLRAEIIAIGSELLTPFRIDTNSLFITRSLEEYGIHLIAKSIVGDDLNELVNAFRVAFERSDVIICTGGLGPTADDLTREALADFLKIKLVFVPEILRGIEARFSKRGVKMPETNRKQAMVPENATVLPNRNGTAPGLYLNIANKQVFLLPGVPSEMEVLWKEQCLPLLRKESPLERKIFRIAMLPESQVDHLLRPVTESLKNVRYTILASPGSIEVQLTAAAAFADEFVSASAEVRAILGKHIYSEAQEDMETVVGSLLLRQKSTVAVAESCTGGLLGHRLTQVPGSSNYFERGVVVYSNQSKIELLGIPQDLIQQYGAVSSQVAAAMVEAIRSAAGVTYGLSITGIAGPDGGTPEKPVGTVFIGLADPEETITERYNFPGNRDRVKFFSTQAALNLLRMKLIGKER
jgi:nicotinamide-nucleotide amidase